LLPRFGTDFPLRVEYLLYLLKYARWRRIPEAICFNELLAINRNAQFTKSTSSKFHL
jgi:hypothetical protein